MRFLVLESRLAPSAAFAAISRWRDRHVGFLPRQLPSLISSAVTGSVIPPDVAWSFTGFFGCYGSPEFAVTCISHTHSKLLKQTIFDAAVRDYRASRSAILRTNRSKLKGATTLQDCASEHGLKAGSLDLLLLELKNADCRSSPTSKCGKRSRAFRTESRQLGQAIGEFGPHDG